MYKSHDVTKKLIKIVNDGSENVGYISDAYRTYYAETILPKYQTAQNNWFMASQDFYELVETNAMTNKEFAAAADNVNRTHKDVAKYENFTVADENFATWKFNIEKNTYAKEAMQTLDFCEKTLNFTSSTLGTLKTINQVQNNKDQLYKTFVRLKAITDNEKLKITLDDYLDKMDNGFASFLSDTSANIYSSFVNTAVQDSAYKGLKDVASKALTKSYGTYSSYAIDGALAKANYLLIAADVGGIFAEKISSTKTVLEKAIEVKYLWNIENESKVMLQMDLIRYSNVPTEENAEAVMNDLFWLKALKLRAITATRDLYVANGDNWLALANSNLGVVANGVESIYTSQRDALVNASLTETEYTNESLVLSDGECYIVNTMDENGYNGSLTTSDGTVMLKNSDKRLTGGVTLKSGSSLAISTTDKIFLSHITMESGATLVIENANLVVGDMTIAENINLGNGSLHISGNLTQTDGTLNVGNGILKVGGDYEIKVSSYNGYAKFYTGKGETRIGGNFIIKAIASVSMQNVMYDMSDENAYWLVEGDFIISGNHTVACNLTAGNLELRGNFSQGSTVTSFRAQGTHKTILSGDGEQSIYFKSPSYSKFNILINKNPAGVIFTTTVNYKELQTVYPTFNINFVSNCGVEIEGQTVDYNKPISAPEGLTNGELMLVGWYTDEAMITPFDFDNGARKDMTLYAKWTDEMFEIDNISRNKDEGTVFVSVSMVEELQNLNGIVMLALYEGDKMIGMVHSETKPTVSYTFINAPSADSAYTVKAFCWAGFKAPLYHSASVDC